MGKRPVTLPIFYQLVGYTLQNYSDQAEMEKVGRTQLGISIISWALLAFSFSLLMNKYALRFLTFMIIIMMGASINITMWDRLMLSDSLSTSLFALLLAYMICISMIWRNKTSLKLWLQIILVIFCIVIALLYSFTRDPNAYFLGSLGLLMMFGILFRSIRKHPLIAGYMVIMFSFFTIFGFQNYLVINSFRDVSSLQHVFVYRFIPDKDRLAFLLDNGMPYDQRFSSYTNLNLKELQLQLSIDDPSGLLMTWIENHGKPVLLKYMISHPTYIFITPLTDLQAMINGNVAGYRKPLSSTPFRLSLLSDFFYPRMTILPYLFIAFFGISLFLLFVNKTSNLLLILVLVLYITAIPFLMLVWNSDTNDIPRHSLQAAIQLRQASWVCFLLLIERFWIFFEKKFQKNKSSFVSAS